MSLLTRALQIKNETVKNANTATRVGGVLEDIIKGSYLQGFFEGSQIQTVSDSNPFKLTIPSITPAVSPQGWTINGNRFTRGTNGNPVFSTATIIVSGAASDKLAFYFAINGTIIPCSKNIARVNAAGGSDLRQVVIQCLINVNEGDFLEVWGQNETDSSDFTLLLSNIILTRV